jgi:ArsR family metal-binding transcriptional regulator
MENETVSYLEAISLTKTLPCLAEPGKIIIIGKPSRALTEVLPYLATLPGIIAWNPEACTLTFRRPHGFMTLYSDKVYITQIKDVAEGMELLDALTEAVNEVWEKRSELIALTTKKRAPHHLDLWELLPRTNCKQCGEATCMAFAVGLLQQNRELAECPVLMADPTLADRRATLESML